MEREARRQGANPKVEGLFAKYRHEGSFCEIFGTSDTPRPSVEKAARRLARLSVNGLRKRARAAERELYNLGITFTVYSDADSIDRVLPFDVLPRILTKDDWHTIESGVKQRVAALNMFLHDVYHAGHILKDKIVPAELVLKNPQYRAVMQDQHLRHDTYVHIAGTDIVRDADGTLLVLEDNCRTPSGVSYVVENRHLMMRAFPELFTGTKVRQVSNYGQKLREALAELAPDSVTDPNVALMSPGVFNSAYFEHVFLAREMGVPLVEGRDLSVENDRVYMKTTAGLVELHVIYRRVDDAFLDPRVFRRDSMLGVPGIMRAYKRGNVSITNAVGTGVADDKAVYAYVPRIIKYYLGEDPILANVPTNICAEGDGLKHTLDNLAELVVKPVDESGGYGVVIGPKASKGELAACRRRLKAKPGKYISQPVVQLSVAPTLTDRGIEARHVDLRPFAVTGRDTWVLPGGLTRVALKRGSMIVNSSQGGGSKDTWVLQ